jgi:hypothetical protein
MKSLAQPASPILGSWRVSQVLKPELASHGLCFLFNEGAIKVLRYPCGGNSSEFLLLVFYIYIIHAGLSLMCGQICNHASSNSFVHLIGTQKTDLLSVSLPSFPHQYFVID